MASFSFPVQRGGGREADGGGVPPGKPQLRLNHDIRVMTSN